MIEDAMALYKFSNLWPKLDKSLLAQMKAEEKILAEEEGKIETWALGFSTFLKCNGEELTVNNRWLCDFVFSREFPLLNLALLRLLARMQWKNIQGINPVLQDMLSENIQTFEDSIYELEDEEQALNLSDDMMNTLFDVTDHLEIGCRLGMDDLTLGVYDALRGMIFSSFSPRYVDAAKSLSAWIKELIGAGKEIKIEALDEQISSLDERFNLLSPVSKDAANYILMDILPEASSK